MQYLFIKYLICATSGCPKGQVWYRKIPAMERPSTRATIRYEGERMVEVQARSFPSDVKLPVKADEAMIYQHYRL